MINTCANHAKNLSDLEDVRRIIICKQHKKSTQVTNNSKLLRYELYNSKKLPVLHLRLNDSDYFHAEYLLSSINEANLFRDLSLKYRCRDISNIRFTIFSNSKSLRRNTISKTNTKSLWNMSIWRTKLNFPYLSEILAVHSDNQLGFLRIPCRSTISFSYINNMKHKIKPNQNIVVNQFIPKFDHL